MTDTATAPKPGTAKAIVGLRKVEGIKPPRKTNVSELREQVTSVLDQIAKSKSNHGSSFEVATYDTKGGATGMVASLRESHGHTIHDKGWAFWVAISPDDEGNATEKFGVFASYNPTQVNEAEAQKAAQRRAEWTAKAAATRAERGTKSGRPAKGAEGNGAG